MRHILTLYTLIIILYGCSSGQPRNDTQKGVADLKSPQEMNDGDKFIKDEDFRNAILKKCASIQTFEYRTPYGNWYKLKNCTFRLDGIDISNTDISIHLEENKLVNGLQFMIFPDTKYGSYLQERQSTHSVNESSTSCSRYYWKTLPLYTHVDKSLCDALIYYRL